MGDITVKALKKVNFSLAPGAFTAFVGPSGSGKTTLLNLIGCLDIPSEGRLTVAGVDVSSLDRKQSALFRENISGSLQAEFFTIDMKAVLRRSTTANSN